MSAPGATTLIVRDGGGTMMGVFGELDLFTSDELGTVVQECLQDRPARLVLDLAGVSFCDAAGLNALVRGKNRAAQVGTDFVVTGVKAPTLVRVLAVTGLDALFGLRQGPAPPGDARGDRGAA
ncbi:STAS domain-containing protein [Streptomyces sp. NPDC020801]|uniref:STAS domain-containing protein n=1 Tax=unclassified Streptomyces TaxID=2593676 RepID=UPI00378B225B